MNWKPGLSTPWGMAQTTSALGSGIYAITTSTHGGLYLPDGVRDELPQEVAESLFLFRSRSVPLPERHNWAEEDCDVDIVMPFIWNRIYQARVANEYGRRAGQLSYWLEHAIRMTHFFPVEYGNVAPLLEALGAPNPITE